MPMRCCQIVGTLCMLALLAPQWSRGQVLADSCLDEVTTVGMRRDKSLTTAAPTFCLDSASLRRMGITDITGALRHVAGIHLRDYGGAGGLKTVNVRGVGATHTTVTYDGMPMADTQGGTVDVSRFAFDLMQSVRLDVGDAAPLLVPVRSLATATLHIGSWAEGEERNQTNVQLRAGSWERINPSFSLRRKLGSKHSLGAAASYFFSNNNYSFRLRNGLHTTTERRHNSRLQSGVGELNWQYRPDARHKLSTKIYASEQRSQLPGPVVLYNQDNAERMGEQLLFAQSRFDYTGTTFNAFAAAKVGRQVQRYENPDPQYPGGGMENTYRQTEAYFTGGVSKSLLSQISVAYAADYYYNYLSTNLVSADGAARHTLLQAFSLRYEQPRLTATLRVTAQTAWNCAPKGMEAPRNLRKLSPSVAVAYKPFGGDFLLRLFYKDYYRQPTFSETYFYHMGTQVLKPERVRQLGAGMTWQGRLPITETAIRLSVDGYYNDLTNKISAIPYNLFVWRMENRGKVVIHGLDVTFHAAQRLSARHRLLFSANYSLQNAVDRTDAADASYGKQSAYLPRHSGAASVTWENPWISCGITFSGASERWATNNHAPSTNMPGYGELGATLYRNFSLRSGVLKASVSAHNLLNKTYEVVRRYPMPTRNFMATLSYNF